MSAEHPTVDRPFVAHDSRLEVDSDSHSDEPPSTVPGGDGTQTEPPLPYRIERTRHRARITALERELAASERRQQSIVTQYERLLEDRSADVESTRSQDRSFLERLFE